MLFVRYYENSLGGFWCDVLKRALLHFVVVRGGEKAGGGRNGSVHCECFVGWWLVGEGKRGGELRSQKCSSR